MRSEAYMTSKNGHKGSERVAQYLRVSSEEQRARETIEIQEEFLEQYCGLYHHQVVETYADDGISGTIPLHERPEGRRLLEDAKAGKFDTVLVYRLDRLGRKLLVVVDAHDRLQEAGVALRSTTEPIDTSNPAGRLIFQMLASFAEFEKESINERTRAGKNRAYRNGVHVGVIPYGYDLAKDGSFVVVEEEAAIVQEVIHNVADGATLFAEAKRLNLQGIPAPGKKYRGRERQHGTTWTPMAISRIVGRTAYSGTHVVHSSSGNIERPVPAIVPTELQDAAIARLGDNKRYSGGQRVRQYLLRGLIRCEEHDWRYSGTARKRRSSFGGGYLFKYLCPMCESRRFDTYTERGSCPTLDALWLEDLVWQEVRGFVENPGEVLERVKEQTQQRREQTGELEQRLASLRKRLAAAHGEKDRYIRVYATGGIDEQELQTYLSDVATRIENLKMLVEATETDLAREEQDAATTRDAASWLAALRENLEALEEDTDEAYNGRRRLIEYLVEKITVGRDENGSPKVRITYKFAPPVDATDGVTDSKTFEILAGDTPIRGALERI
jgi:site-specific DNA recombinase